MIILKNSELELTLFTISIYSSPKEGELQKLTGGLLSENLSLGTKRRLQKIHKKILEAYNELVEEIKKIREACKIGENDKNEPIFDQEKLNKEIQELLNEDVKLDIEPAQLSQIENISTSSNYNFEIIEKIAM